MCGIISGACSDATIDHGVLAVGFAADESGKQYFRVKNSWGTAWGEKGYFRIARNDSAPAGQCGMLSFSSVPLLAVPKCSRSSFCNGRGDASPSSSHNYCTCTCDTGSLGLHCQFDCLDDRDCSPSEYCLSNGTCSAQPELPVSCEAVGADAVLCGVAGTAGFFCNWNSPDLLRSSVEQLSKQASLKNFSMNCDASFGGGNSTWVEALGQSLATLQLLEILKLDLSSNYGVGDGAADLLGAFMPTMKRLKDLTLEMFSVRMSDAVLQQVGKAIGNGCEELQVSHYAASFN